MLRPLLGPDRGLPRRAVLHLLFGHSLHDAAGCRAWVARLSSLVGALETAPTPALAFSAPSPTTGRAWSALASEDLAELLLGRLDAGTRLVPDLDREERRELLREACLNGSVLLILGSMLIGWFTGPKGMEQGSPVIKDLFLGALCLFLLDMGLVAGRRLGALRRSGPLLLGFALVFPMVAATLGIGAMALGVTIGHVGPDATGDDLAVEGLH